MQSTRINLQKRLSAAQFAVIETGLFLDTHPNDAAAMEAFKKYVGVYRALYKEYTEKYGPLTQFDSTCNNLSFDWLDNPWPWENMMECDK